MKCQACGAEIGNNTVCEFCGTQISAEMKKEQERLNKQVCPKCSSSNVVYGRENQGEIRNKNGKRVLHQTVALCKDCGNTWYPNGKAKPKQTWLWVLGWIFIFPLPLTLILLKKKDLKAAIKYSIIAIAWVLYLVIVISGNSSNRTTKSNKTDSTAQSVSVQDNGNTADDSLNNAELFKFMISFDEAGEYGKKWTINKYTESEYTFYAFYIPAGTYSVVNKSNSGTAQVSVYSNVKFDGHWEQFIDEDCSKPILVTANEEAKTILVKEGQFVKLSDDSINIEFTLIN
ncbi:MAG: hypothetical protein IJK60_08535 [Clostridia bacterium]|nr:hypothetical protein [Clostridia bacterium]